MNLPIEVIDNIVSFVMQDRLMFSPTAKIMKAYFRELTWDTSEFFHDLVRSQSGIHRYEMDKILRSKAWFKLQMSRAKRRGARQQTPISRAKAM